MIYISMVTELENINTPIHGSNFICRFFPHNHIYHVELGLNYIGDKKQRKCEVSMKNLAKSFERGCEIYEAIKEDAMTYCIKSL